MFEKACSKQNFFSIPAEFGPRTIFLSLWFHRLCSFCFGFFSIIFFSSPIGNFNHPTHSIYSFCRSFFFINSGVDTRQKLEFLSSILIKTTTTIIHTFCLSLTVKPKDETTRKIAVYCSVTPSTNRSLCLVNLNVKTL